MIGFYLFIPRAEIQFSQLNDPNSKLDIKKENLYPPTNASSML